VDNGVLMFVFSSGGGTGKVLGWTFCWLSGLNVVDTLRFLSDVDFAN
jgi:hypothetical protein